MLNITIQLSGRGCRRNAYRKHTNVAFNFEDLKVFPVCVSLHKKTIEMEKHVKIQNQLVTNSNPLSAKPLSEKSVFLLCKF